MTFVAIGALRVLEVPANTLILKMLSAEVVYCMYLIAWLIIVSNEANSVNPYQTAPTGAVWSGSTLFFDKASETF